MELRGGCIAASFLTSTLDNEWSHSRLDHFTLGDRASVTHWIGDWSAPTLRVTYLAHVRYARHVLCSWSIKLAPNVEVSFAHVSSPHLLGAIPIEFGICWLQWKWAGELQVSAQREPLSERERERWLRSSPSKGPSTVSVSLPLVGAIITSPKRHVLYTRVERWKKSRTVTVKIKLEEPHGSNKRPQIGFMFYWHTDGHSAHAITNCKVVRPWNQTKRLDHDWN